MVKIQGVAKKEPPPSHQKRPLRFIMDINGKVVFLYLLIRYMCVCIVIPTQMFEKQAASSPVAFINFKKLIN